MPRWIWWIVIPLLTPVLIAQSVRTEEIAVGKFLVAHRKLGDPNFAESVILIVHYDSKGAMGLIVNRKTQFTLAKIFEDVKGAADQSDLLFFGGPVETRSILALVRSETAPRDATHIFQDIYLVTRKTQLDKAVAAQPDPRRFRAFMGYSGWGAGQLEAEMETGSWYVFPASAATAFDPAPTSVWNRLIRITEQQVAQTGAKVSHSVAGSE
jgi:putative transcriptional regulator